MRKTTVWAVGLVLMLGLAGCWELISTTVERTTAPTWTGTGMVTSGSSANGHAVGLAGEDIYVFSRAGSGTTIVHSSPLAGMFSGSHVLKSITMTSAKGLHEEGFVLGHETGVTDERRLLYSRGFNTLPYWAPAFSWVLPQGSPSWVEGPDWLEVMEICDLAGGADRNFTNPNSPDSHLFMSVRACLVVEGELTSACYGGVVEAEFNGSRPTRWHVRSVQHGWQGNSRRPNGSRYDNECMPISVTTGGDGHKPYLILGDPSHDEAHIYDANSLYLGPIATLGGFDPSRTILDVVLEGRVDGINDLGFAVIVWDAPSNHEFTHHMLINGMPIPAAPWTETVPSNVQFLDKYGVGAPTSPQDVAAYGAQVVRHTYAE